MPCFASSLLDSNRRQRALQISAGPIGQGDYYQPVRCLVLVYGKTRVSLAKTAWHCSDEISPGPYGEIHAVFFISIIYKQHFFQLVKFPKKISNKLVFWPEKKQHLQQDLSKSRLFKIKVFISNQYIKNCLNTFIIQQLKQLYFNANICNQQS